MAVRPIPGLGQHRLYVMKVRTIENQFALSSVGIEAIHAEVTSARGGPSRDKHLIVPQRGRIKEYVASILSQCPVSGMRTPFLDAGKLARAVPSGLTRFDKDDQAAGGGAWHLLNA